MPQRIVWSSTSAPFRYTKVCVQAVLAAAEHDVIVAVLYPGYRRYLLTSGRLTSILFIHGLTGDREKTWTAKNTSEPWPRTLLPSKVPNARVLTFGYNAYVADWRELVSQVRIGNHAMNLLTTLVSYREDDDTVRLIYSHLLGKLNSYGAEQPPDHICLP
jgi:hypothetical protein